jgi:hypothetical protein
LAERITCTHVNGAGQECGRFLGEVADGQVLIYCPACKTMHAMEIVVLMRHLDAYLREVEAQAGKRSRRVVGFA